MTTTFLARAAGLACALLLFAGAASAKTVTVIPGDVPVTVEIPSSWTVSAIKRGTQAKTADDEVYLWFESYRPSQLQTIVAEHNAYFKEQGVAITGEAKQTEKAYPGYVLKFSEYPATYEGKPTILRYISIVPKDADRRNLLLSYWASPEGDKEYNDEMETIIDSLRKSVDAM